jgi:hypothetical protein
VLRVALLLIMLCVGAGGAAQAQSAVSATRRQRLIASVHLPRLRTAVSPPSSFTPLLDLRAFLPREPVLRQQLRLPISDRLDVTASGRIGFLGPSSSLRVRLRF